MKISLFSLQLHQASNEQEFRQLLDCDKFDFRYACGVPQPSSLIRVIDCDTIVSSVTMHYSVLVCKAELDQLVQSLESLQVLELVRANPQIMKPLFVGTSSKLNITADDLFDLLPAQFSPAGSNRRESEENVVMDWDNYNHMIEGYNIITNWEYFRQSKPSGRSADVAR